jgi:hypothetical protein
VPELRRPVLGELLSAGAREWLGEPTPEIVAAVESKREFVAELGHWPASGAAWMAVRSELAPALEQFDAVDGALTVAGIPAESGFLGVDEAMLRATFRYSNRLRARYTTVDFLEGQGVLDRAIEDFC